jgi:hypothetical protein
MPVATIPVASLGYVPTTLLTFQTPFPNMITVVGKLIRHNF